MDYLSWFPERIAELRMQKNVSARDMSLSLGQSASYINKIENRRTLPSVTGLIYICEYFGITPQQFFDMDSPYPSQFATLMEDLKQLDFETLSHLTALVKRLVQNK